MKRFILLFLAVCVPISMVHAREVAVTMNKVSTSGIGEAVGVVVITETDSGLRITPFLHGMPTGDYSISINETFSCHSSISKAGIPMPAMAAGNSLWQLPDIKISAMGDTLEPMHLANVGFNDISRRSIVVSKRTSSTLGFSQAGERVACGSLEQY